MNFLYIVKLGFHIVITTLHDTVRSGFLYCYPCLTKDPGWNDSLCNLFLGLFNSYYHHYSPQLMLVGQDSDLFSVHKSRLFFLLAFNMPSNHLYLMHGLVWWRFILNLYREMFVPLIWCGKLNVILILHRWGVFGTALQGSFALLSVRVLFFHNSIYICHQTCKTSYLVNT